MRKHTINSGSEAISHLTDAWLDLEGVTQLLTVQAYWVDKTRARAIRKISKKRAALIPQT